MLVRDGSRYILRVSELTWDSKMLGFPCASLDISDSTRGNDLEYVDISSLLSDLLLDAKKQGIRFVTAKINAENISLVTTCISNHGKLVDSELTFKKNKQMSSSILSLPDGIHIIKADCYWDDSLYELAATVKNSRYFIDTTIPYETAYGLWKHSIYNSCNGRASYSIISFIDDKPVALMNVFEKDGISDIYLIAVLPHYQGKGLGKFMMRYYENSLGDNICHQVVDTQLINYPAQKLYSDMGYRNVRSKHTIHFWL
jgi:ribosomal protein S18 acetylase RimI-like enzyme